MSGQNSATGRLLRKGVIVLVAGLAAGALIGMAISVGVLGGAAGDSGTDVVEKPPSAYPGDRNESASQHADRLEEAFIERAEDGTAVTVTRAETEDNVFYVEYTLPGSPSDANIEPSLRAFRETLVSDWRDNSSNWGIDYMKLTYVRDGEPAATARVQEGWVRRVESGWTVGGERKSWNTSQYRAAVYTTAKVHRDTPPANDTQLQNFTSTMEKDYSILNATATRHGDAVFVTLESNASQEGAEEFGSDLGVAFYSYRMEVKHGWDVRTVYIRYEKPDGYVDGYTYTTRSQAVAWNTEPDKREDIGGHLTRGYLDSTDLPGVEGIYR